MLNLRKSENEGSKTRVILILSQYGSKEALIDEVRSRWSIITDIKQRLNEMVQAVENIIEKGSIQCRECKGTGKITKVKYVREGGIITPYFDAIECQKCQGKGIIKLPDQFKNHLAMTTNIAKKVSEFGDTLLNLINEVTLQ